jgi:predicted DNA-binding protein
VRYVVVMKETPISLRLDRELRKALEDLAAKDLRTLSDYIRVVLTRHVEGKKEGAK